MLVVVLALAACERNSPTTKRAWWCWKDSVCFAMRDACQRTATAAHVETTCVPHATAFCRHGCDPLTPDKEPSCGRLCAVDREACEVNDRRTTPCREESPPSHPELFPNYVEPGWWCWSQRGPDGNEFSWCDQMKERCEWFLDDTLRKVGLTRAMAVASDAGAGAGCTRPTTPVYCWSRTVDGELAFVCTLSRQLCEASRATLPSMPVPPGHTVRDASECAPWPYD